MEEAYLNAQPKVRTAADDEEDLRKEAAPMTAADAIKRTLLAWKDKDYFRCGCLPWVLRCLCHIQNNPVRRLYC